MNAELNYTKAEPKNKHFIEYILKIF